MSARTINMPYLRDSSVYFSRLKHLDRPVWLDSGRPSQTRGRYDIISALPESTLTATNKSVVWQNQASAPVIYDDFWAALKEITGQPPITDSSNGLPFNGGAIGYIGYDLGRRVEKLDDSIADDIETPLAELGFYHWALISDHEKQCATLMFCNDISEEKQRMLERLLASDAQDRGTKAAQFRVLQCQPNTSKEDYCSALDRIHNYITAGDCYQVNYAQRFDLPYKGDPFVAYQELREALPSQYSAYLSTPTATVLSLSPECFLTIDKNGHVTTKPIKGTIARGDTKEADDFLASKLLHSEKDRAENLMIVDLLRNDLSKSCASHSVTTPKLFELESYANVHHLVSTVTGQIESQGAVVGLIKDCFPGGSITGAPKVRAMEIIEELEASRRSIYCGSIGYLSYDGQVDLNIAIRSLLFTKDVIHCWGGGGIVADSNTEAEYEETLNKIGILTSTLMDCFGSTPEE